MDNWVPVFVIHGLAVLVLSGLALLYYSFSKSRRALTYDMFGLVLVLVTPLTLWLIVDSVNLVR